MPNLSDFQYPLPPELIARHPAEPRDSSRLLVVHRGSGTLEHARFRDLPRFLGPGDLLVLNDSRVQPVRLLAQDGAVELLLLEESSPGHWVALGSPGKKLLPGARLRLDPPHGPAAEAPTLEVLKTLPGGERVLRVHGTLDLDLWGRMPLPPYILKARRAGGEDLDQPRDRADYQTVFAREPGSAAAPTAGLHFTPELLASFDHAFLTLHVGLGTFRPVKTARLEDHEMHSEHFSIPPGLRERCDAARRVVAVGTTACRVLESRPSLAPGPGETRLFITPPHTFQRTGALLTNFHLPGSTLLMLTAAFAGHALQRRAYEEAIHERYRFFSFGDAMLIL